MPVSIKEGNGQEVLGQMYDGEKIKIGGDAEALVELAQPDPQDELDVKEESLPDEVITYLRSMIPDFPEIVEDLAGEMIERWKEKEAHRTLFERFGLPRSFPAVGVFKILWDNLDAAQKDLRGKALETQAFIYRVEQTLRQVLLVVAMELNRLDEERKDCGLAIGELEATSIQGATMQEKTTQSITFFAEKKDELDVDQSKMKQSFNRLSGFMERLMSNLNQLRRIETPLDVAAPDPMMAVPA